MNDCPWMIGRDRTPIIEFGKWMRSRPPYRCPKCGAYYGGLYKPVGMCPACGTFVRKAKIQDREDESYEKRMENKLSVLR